MNKRKIINDPLYGFITIPNELIYDIINHRYFQRLRRIRQLGMTDFVYPGALHTRFHHALGSMHLMNESLNILIKKDIEISDEEYNAALIAILLHDIGHAPFSHALENELIRGVDHEEISAIIMDYLNEEFNGELSMAIDIFKGNYPRKFLKQLVSSQLDIDRLDYLNRDSFFTGVVEGKIGSERILKLMNVCNDELVVEEKGIYSIENFLSARRLMYWQVYMHKTTVGVERMLIQILKRVREVNQEFVASDELRFFIENEVTPEQMVSQKSTIDAFCRLDDFDVIGGIKSWQKHDDKILSLLSNMLLERRLFNVWLSENKFDRTTLGNLKKMVKSDLGLNETQADHFVIKGAKTNSAYIAGDQQIGMLKKNGQIVDIANASDLPNIKAMRKIVKKYYLCWPKSISLYPKN